MVRHLVVGGDGLIGRAIFDFLKRQSADVHRTTRRPAQTGLSLDLRSPDCTVEGAPGLDRLFDGAPLVVYLAAAITGYAQCDADPAGTRQVNVVSTVRLAEEFISRGAFVVFPSSTAVFSGSRSTNVESDATDPVSEYGKQKAEAEARLRALPAAAVGIVRLTKVVAPGAGIIAHWIRDLRAGRGIEAARDLRFSPISLPYAAGNLVRLGASGQRGTFHLSGSREITYLEFAGLLATALGVSPDRVASVAVKDRLATGTASQVGMLDMTETAARTGLRPQEPAEVVADLLAA